MQIACVGKSNTGKSTFFSAATLVDAEISNRIFTTIEPNQGASYVRTECPCKESGKKCNPNDKCVDGNRFVPVKMLDIAGLVPGAHEGRGLGNKFLSDIMEANALIHVIDISGSTDDDGNPLNVGEHDPIKDVAFLEEEIDYWLLGILKNNWSNIQRRAGHEKLEKLIYDQLSGLMIDQNVVENLVKDNKLSAEWDESKILKFVSEVRKLNKPLIMVGNKVDKTGELYEKMKDDYDVIPCSAESELALRKASEAGLVKYLPGDSSFEIIGDLTDKQREAMDVIKGVMDKYGSTGVQSVINKTVFDLLGMIVVYPVENESKWSDAKGNVLPDAKLLKKGATARDLAYAVHEDIGKSFIAAINCKTGQKIGADKALENGDVVSIKAGK